MDINNINAIFEKNILTFMFKTNNQPELFTFEKQLLDNEQRLLLEKTPEKAFYNIVFTNINENDYKVTRLFSERWKISLLKAVALFK